MIWEKQNGFPGEGKNWKVEVHCQEKIEEWFLDYFCGVEIKMKEGEGSILKGEFQDISGVFGFILKLRDATIDFLSLEVKKSVGQDKNY